MANKAALFQMGMDLVEAQNLDAKAPDSRKAQEEVLRNGGANLQRSEVKSSMVVQGPWTVSDENLDHFITVDGKKCAGKHMIIDLWGARDLDKLDLMEATMRKVVDVCGATLLHIHLHHFQPNGGISGVAVLAESHISVHTWPERDYAAFDVFMCGDSRPELATQILQDAFQAKEAKADRLLRGECDA